MREKTKTKHPAKDRAFSSGGPGAKEGVLGAFSSAVMVGGKGRLETHPAAGGAGGAGLPSPSCMGKE